MQRQGTNYAIGGWTPNAVTYYTKRREHFKLSPVGRWGPKWLHRLVFWIAKNLGMVGHPIDSRVERNATFRTVRSDDPSVVNHVREALLTSSSP